MLCGINTAGAKAVATFECKDDIFEKSFQKCCLVETVCKRM